MSFSMLTLAFWYRGLETLEQRIGVIVLGNVVQLIIGDKGQGTMRNLTCGEPGADQLRGSLLRKGIDCSLYGRSSHLSLESADGRRIGLGRRVAHEMGGGRGYFAAKGLELTCLKGCQSLLDCFGDAHSHRELLRAHHLHHRQPWIVFARHYGYGVASRPYRLAGGNGGHKMTQIKRDFWRRVQQDQIWNWVGG